LLFRYLFGKIRFELNENHCIGGVKLVRIIHVPSDQLDLL